jgi:glycosyltransferase involved in cell wall biosynthesis
MQNYEPLMGKYDLTAYTTYDNKFELDEIKIPIKKLHSPNELIKLLPSSLRHYPRAILFKLGGCDTNMFGLEKELSDKDIAHAVEVYNGFSYQSIKAKEENRQLKVVITVWENIPFKNKNIRREKVLRNTDLFIAVTRRAKEALMLEGVEEERIRIIGMGVDLDKFKPAEKSKDLMRDLGLTDDHFVVLYVGRLIWEKGVYDLLYAARMIARDSELSSIKFKFLLRGDGDEKEGIIKVAKLLGISENISLVKRFPYHKLPEIYNLADIFVLPSIPTWYWQEQFGWVLAEAMASGRAIISTLSGSIPEVVRDAGLLIQPNDPLSLYDAIKKLAKNEGLRKSLEVKAREYAQREFDCLKIANNIGRIYESVGQ